MDAAPVAPVNATPFAPSVDFVAMPNVEGSEENENVVPANDDEPQQALDEPLAVEPVRRSQRERKSTIPQDYEVSMNEDANDIGKADDPSTYKEAMKDENSSKYSEVYMFRMSF